MDHVCAAAALHAREIDASIADGPSDMADGARQRRIVAAKEIRVALETGGIVIGYNTWRAGDDNATTADAFGLVSDVTDMGDIHGVVVGDRTDMRVAWRGRNWVLHRAATPVPAHARERHTLTRAAERIRASHTDDRVYGLEAMDYWLEADGCGDRGRECAGRYASVVVDACRVAVGQLKRAECAAAPDSREATADASRRYARIAQLLWPLTQGATDASRSLLSEARDELDHAAEALASIAKA